MRKRYLHCAALALSILLFAGCSSLEKTTEADSRGKCVIKNRTPENRAVVSSLNTMQRMVSKLSCKELEALWADRIFMQRIAAAPCASMPQGVDFSWTCEGDVKNLEFILLLADNEELKDAIRIPATPFGVRVQNLVPGKTYFWKVVLCGREPNNGASSSKISSFTLDDVWPRVLCINGAYNSRDLGGMSAMAGRKIPYGMLYRSSDIGSNAICPVMNHGACKMKNHGACKTMNHGACKTMNHGACKMKNCAALELGIKTEIDLRWSNETNGQDASAFAGASYRNIPGWLYNSIYTNAGMRNNAAIFHVLADAENYPIDFHCIVGADRTGTLAFLLEALLGCPEEEIRKDYVFSSFASPRYFSAIDLLIEGMNFYKASEDEPLQHAVERYLLKSGVSSEEIRNVQEILLGKDIPISPVLDAYLRIASLKAEFASADAVGFVENSPVNGMMKQCGKEYPFTMAGWVENPVKFAGSNNKGSFLFQFENSGRDVRYGSFRGAGLVEKAYSVLDPIEKTALVNADGETAWSVEELAETAFPLKGSSEGTMLLVPATIPVPEGYARKAPEYLDANFLVASSVKAAPVIDGRLDDEMWTSQTPVQLVAIDGTPVASNRSMVSFGTNPEHDVLYMAVRIEDDSFVGSEWPRDGKCWADDEVEVFISAVGDSTYYQLIWNRVGSFLDGKGQNAAWTLEKFEAKTGECEGGWVLEAAIPLEQLNLPNAIEINVCTTDVPKGIQRNLGLTGGTYHTREAFKPILLK